MVRGSGSVFVDLLVWAAQAWIGFVFVQVLWRYQCGMCSSDPEEYVGWKSRGFLLKVMSRTPRHGGGSN